MSDIVERLRSLPWHEPAIEQAADEIELLRSRYSSAIGGLNEEVRLRDKEIERLRQKNKNLADNCYELRQEHERLTAENALLLEQHAEVHANYNQAQDVIMSLRAALRSIANNTCCGPCQEAAVVARASLNQSEQDDRGDV